MTRSPLPPLNALRAFEAAARHGNFAAAATDLHVTHWAVGKQIKLLVRANLAILIKAAIRKIKS